MTTDPAKLDELLNTWIEPTGFGEQITIKRYLAYLLHELWEKGESFSGKHPFGNSGWEDDLLVPMIELGLVDGRVDREPNGEVAYIVGFTQSDVQRSITYDLIERALGFV